MKKAIVSLAALAVLAIAPAANATLTAPWGGYGSEHCDNAGSAAYWLSFGTNGAGNSHYYVDPAGGANSCGGTDTSIVTTGYLMNPATGQCLSGCNHGTHNGQLGGIFVKSTLVPLPTPGGGVGIEGP